MSKQNLTLMTTEDLKRIRTAILKKKPIPPDDLAFLRRIEKALKDRGEL
ncbi:hypothetical protein [Kordia jejudonensis]|nr:hypothetical protein [Kordia jejudonensis]